MNLDFHPNRKLDFMAVVAAVLLLWGPGLTLPWGSRPELLRPAQASLTRTLPGNPCDNDTYPLPAESGLDRASYSTRVKVTGYSSSTGETDQTPHLTAANTRTRHGIIALSQDLLQEFTPGAPFRFHDRVEIPGLGQFQVEDTMHPRWTRRADVWFSSRSEAIHWGVRSRELFKLPEDLAAGLPMPGPDQVAATFGKANFR